MSHQAALSSRAAFAAYAEEHIEDEDYLDDSRTPEQILQVRHAGPICWAAPQPAAGRRPPPPPPEDRFPSHCAAPVLQRLEEGFNALSAEARQAYAAKGAAREQAERAFAGLRPLAAGCDILHAALLVLQTADPHEKARLTNRIAELWAQGLITPPGPGSRVQAPDHPARDGSKVGGKPSAGGRPSAPGSLPCASQQFLGTHWLPQRVPLKTPACAPAMHSFLTAASPPLAITGGACCRCSWWQPRMCPSAARAAACSPASACSTPWFT